MLIWLALCIHSERNDTCFVVEDSLLVKFLSVAMFVSKEHSCWFLEGMQNTAGISLMSRTTGIKLPEVQLHHFLDFPLKETIVHYCYQVCVCVCVCLPLPSNQSLYRLIAGCWMDGGDHAQGVKGGHAQTN